MIKTRDLQVVKMLGDLRAKQLELKRKIWWERKASWRAKKKERTKELQDRWTRGVEHQVGKGIGCQVIRQTEGEWRGYPLVLFNIDSDEHKDRGYTFI
jgi:hypothetical protein